MSAYDPRPGTLSVKMISVEGIGKLRIFFERGKQDYRIGGGSVN